MNLGVVIMPGLRAEATRLGFSVPARPGAGHGLWQHRLHPSGTPEGHDVWWDISDAASAQRAVADIVSQLETRWFAVLDDLLTREGMLQQLRRGDLGYLQATEYAGHFARAEAVLVEGLHA